jgi:hypothetical protein
MNIDQLLDAMADSDPSPNAVLAMVGRKRRAARARRIYAATSAAAVVAVVVLGLFLHGMSPGSQSQSASAPAGAFSGPAAVPAANGLSSGAGSQAGSAGEFSGDLSTGACSQAALGQILSRAVRSGASVIVGTATLASNPVGHTAGSGSATYYPVTLTSVRTLAGPSVAAGAVVWIPGASLSASRADTGRPPPAPDSQVFGIVDSPAHSALPGPVLQAAPVDGGEVIVSSGGCWNTIAFPAPLPQGLAITPGPRPASPEIPLAAAEKLAMKA